MAGSMARTNIEPKGLQSRNGFETGKGFKAARLETVVVGTGVDPVTFRFSGGRSAN